jgi:hypothetical protein
LREIVDENHIEGFVFENKTVGGVIPKEFIPAVEQGVQERRTGARGGFITDETAFLRRLSTEQRNEINAMMFKGMMNTLGAVPGNKMAETAAVSDRTPEDIRKALMAALAERDADRAAFAAQMQEASAKFEKAAGSIERAAQQRGAAPAVRPNWSSKAQQEAAVPTE